jgi:hypothetical protein
MTRNMLLPKSLAASRKRPAKKHAKHDKLTTESLMSRRALSQHGMHSPQMHFSLPSIPHKRHRINARVILQPRRVLWESNTWADLPLQLESHVVLVVKYPNSFRPLFLVLSSNCFSRASLSRISSRSIPCFSVPAIL